MGILVLVICCLSKKFSLYFSELAPFFFGVTSSRYLTINFAKVKLALSRQSSYSYLSRLRWVYFTHELASHLREKSLLTYFWLYLASSRHFVLYFLTLPIFNFSFSRTAHVRHTLRAITKEWKWIYKSWNFNGAFCFATNFKLLENIYLF